MNPITKVLRTLRHTSTAWSIIICPNPRTDTGNVVSCSFPPVFGRRWYSRKYNDRPGTFEFRLNLHRGIYLDQFLRDFPMCAWVAPPLRLFRFSIWNTACSGASNMTYHIPPKHMRKYHTFPVLITQIFSCSLESDLLRIIHKDLKNEKGKTVQEVLVDILKKFPKYDFETKEGSEAAICDMEKKLVSIADIASFEEVELGTKFGERVGR